MLQVQHSEVRPRRHARQLLSAPPVHERRVAQHVDRPARPRRSHRHVGQQVLQRLKRVVALFSGSVAAVDGEHVPEIVHVLVDGQRRVLGLAQSETEWLCSYDLSRFRLTVTPVQAANHHRLRLPQFVA